MLKLWNVISLQNKISLLCLFVLYLPFIVEFGNVPCGCPEILIYTQKSVQREIKNSR